MGGLRLKAELGNRHSIFFVCVIINYRRHCFLIFFPQVFVNFEEKYIPDQKQNLFLWLL